MKTVCLNVNFSSAKRNILLDGTIHVISTLRLTSFMQRGTNLFPREHFIRDTILWSMLDGDSYPGD